MWGQELLFRELLFRYGKSICCWAFIAVVAAPSGLDHVLLLSAKRDLWPSLTDPVLIDLH